jgi:hypothetical protein
MVIALAVAGASLAGPARRACAEDAPDLAAATGNDVWLLSSRYAGSGGQPCLQAWHYHAGEWLPASSDEFVAAAHHQDLPTCFWIHGNWIDHYAAAAEGWRVYEALKRYAPPGYRFRFVIWSWPATQSQPALRDVRAKAVCSDVHAYYLAWLLGQLPPTAQVSVWGFSYGARLGTGALHLLGGGMLAGRTLQDEELPGPLEVADAAAAGRHPRLRGVLLASGTESCSLAVGQRHGRALDVLERLLVLYNSRDSVLHWYPLLYGLHGPTALGYTGVAGYLGDNRAKVSQIDAGAWIGNQHDWEPYVYSPALMNSAAPLLLFLP